MQEQKLNLSEEEIYKFSQMANRWWDPTGECKPLHSLNPTRTKYILENCEVENKTIIDIGCGGGLLSEELAKNKANVTALDVTNELIKIAKLHALESNLEIEYINTTCEEYAYKDPNNLAKFDVLTCMELLEHVPDPLSLIKACSSLVKPNGKVFFSTLNRTPKSYLLAILGAEYVLRLLPIKTHSYEKFIRPSELNAWFKECGLIIKDIRGMNYNPLTNQSSLTDNTKVNYLVYAIKQE